MSFLTGRHPDEPRTVVALGLRAVWLHLAVTGPGAAALTSRDRDALALIATSAYGVSADAVARHLRRGGASRTAALACIRRLVLEGYLSSSVIDVSERNSQVPVIDLPIEDLAWIVGMTQILVETSSTSGPTSGASARLPVHPAGDDSRPA